MATGTELCDLAQTVILDPVAQGPSAQAFLGGLGAVCDTQSGLDRDVAKMRQTAGVPMQATAQRYGVTVIPTAGDAERLRRLGLSKNLTRYASETDAQFEARIDSAIDDAVELGTAAAIERELKAYGIVDVEVYEECYAAPVAGRRYEYRFGVLLGPDFGSLGWGPMTIPFTLPATLGLSGATPEQISDLVRIILRLKTAASLPIEIVFRFGNAAILDSGLYPLTLPFTLGGLTDGAEVRPLVGCLLDLGTTLPFELWGHYLITLP